MPIKTVLLTACLGLVLSPGFAAPPAAAAAVASTAATDNLVPPTPLVVVPPARLPAEYDSATIKIELIVDVHGHPSHVEVAELVSTELRELVTSAVEKWQFVPATRHGQPVSVRVILPLNLLTTAANTGPARRAVP